MSWLDVLIVLILVFHMIWGWRKGLLKMLGMLGGLIIGVWSAVRYSRSLTGLISRFVMGPEWLLFLLSFLGLMVIARLLCELLILWVKRFFKLPLLGTLDRVIGAALGLSIAVMLVLLAIGITTWLAVPFMPQLLQASEIGQYFWAASPVITGQLWSKTGLQPPWPRLFPLGANGSLFGR